MTEVLYSWMRSLVSYFILLSAVMNFLPDNSYKKYIQYYMGLLLILVILSPIFQLTSLQEEIDAYVSQFQEREAQADVWQERAESWEQQWRENSQEQYGVEVVP